MHAFKSISMLVLGFLTSLAVATAEESKQMKRNVANYLPIETVSVFRCQLKGESKTSTLPSATDFEVELILNTSSRRFLASPNFPVSKDQGKRISEMSEGLLFNITDGQQSNFNARFFQLEKNRTQAKVFQFTEKGTQILDCAVPEKRSPSKENSESPIAK